jgi:hypothetical protein
MNTRNCLFVLIILVSSCNSSKKQLSPKEKFDQLENVFSVANWQITDGPDTSYLYFSRLGDLDYSVYDFKIIQGDSSLQELSTIGYRNNRVTWEHLNDTATLVSSDTVTLVWNSIKGDKMLYRFKKLSDSTIAVELPGGRKFTMTKTLPLATFLVRSRYDYMNHTHTVDSPMVPSRGKPIE